MSTTNLNIRIDKNLKEHADNIFSNLGLNMTTAINIFLRTVIRENGIPFELKLDNYAYNEKDNSLEPNRIECVNSFSEEI